MKNLASFIIILLIIGIAGCSSKEEKTTTSTTTSSQNQDIMKENPIPKETQTLTSNALPDDFPKDIPMYKDSKLLSSVKGGTGPIVTIATNDGAKDVGDFYKSEMKKNGYKADSHNEGMTNKYGGVWEFTKEGKTCTLSFRYDSTKTRTTITFQMSDAH